MGPAPTRALMKHAAGDEFLLARDPQMSLEFAGGPRKRARGRRRGGEAEINDDGEERPKRGERERGEEREQRRG